MRTTRLRGVIGAIGVTIAALLFSGCGPAPPEEPPFQPTVTMQELMLAVVDPAADVLWGSVGTIISEEGVDDFFPRTEEEWIAVENACVTLMESANLLMIPGRAQDQGEWMRQATGLIDAGKLALDAAKSRNPDEIFLIGGEVYAACDGCHQRYWVEGADPDGVRPESAATSQ